MNQVSTRARTTLTYTHEWVDESGKKEKVGSFDLRLLPDVKGIVKWLVPDDEGRANKPQADNFDEFLLLVCHPADLATMADEMEAGHFGEAARYDAALTAWKNSMGEVDYVSISMLIFQLKKEAEELELIIEEAKETEAEEVTAPLDD